MEAKRANEVRDDAMLLDVREPHEWEAGHIEGSVHVPMTELNARQDLLPEDRLIVCVCRSGQRSGVVADALVRAGYQAENLDGGVLAWVSDQLPLVADDGSPGRIV